MIRVLEYVNKNKVRVSTGGPNGYVYHLMTDFLEDGNILIETMPDLIDPTVKK